MNKENTAQYWAIVRREDGVLEVEDWEDYVDVSEKFFGEVIMEDGKMRDGYQPHRNKKRGLMWWQTKENEFGPPGLLLYTEVPALIQEMYAAQWKAQQRKRKKRRKK